MICKNCGNEQKDGGKFCAVCGTPVSDEREQNVQIPNASETNGQGVNVQMPINQSRNMQGYKPTAQNGSQNKKRKSFLLIVSVALIAFMMVSVCVAMCFYVFTSLKHKTANKEVVQTTTETENREEQKEEKDIATKTPVETPAETPVVQREYANVDITAVDNSEFPKVTLYFSVKDLEDQYIDTVQASQLSISERQNGSSEDWQTVQADLENYGTQDNRKKSVAFVMDTSGSMEGSLEAECAAADALLDSMEQDGNYSVAFTAFSTEQHDWLDYTRDYSDFRDYMDDLSAYGETAFYDTLENTLQHALYQDGQKYILAFTDGADTNSSTTSHEVLAMSRAYKIPIYIITMSDMDEYYLADVEEIAENSGGCLYTIDDIEDLEQIYYEVFELQTKQYSFTYESSQTSGYSDIRLQFVSDCYEGETEESFYAEKPSYYYEKPEIAKVSASSECKPMFDSNQKKCTYEASNVCDGDNRTAWVEGKKGDGIGEYLTIKLKKESVVNGIVISNGYYKNTDVYYRNNRVKKVKLTFSDGSSKTYKLEDNFLETCDITFDDPVVTSKIKIEILSVYKSKSLNGKKAFQDTCITELEIY